MYVALISSSGIRLADLPDPLPAEWILPQTGKSKWDRPSPRRFVRQDEHTYVEQEQIGKVTRHAKP